MDTHGYPFHVDPSIQEFFLDTDLVIGNLEGIITHLPKPLFALSHTEKIIEALSRIQSPEQIALCVSNNHSSDFGHKAFQDSVNILSNNGLKIFGTKKSPSYMHTQRINIVGASMWSNKKNCSYITRFDETGQHLSKKPGCFNIFFPHWGYEIELWPRPEIIRLGYSLLDDWDMIFGHHSHVPQPITAVPKGHTNKLLAYSGGDLVTGIRFQKYRYGMIAKCTIGPIETSPESLAVGSVEWMFTHVEQCLSSKPNKRGQSGFMVKTTPSCRYFRSI
ncbi:MAG: CapA family protein [Deltaproteobacteria bacterium]|nr:CapA family protein [Deltaproteobacteria bacterium]